MNDIIPFMNEEKETALSNSCQWEKCFFFDKTVNDTNSCKVLHVTEGAHIKRWTTVHYHRSLWKCRKYQILFEQLFSLLIYGQFLGFILYVRFNFQFWFKWYNNSVSCIYFLDIQKTVSKGFIQFLMLLCLGIQTIIIIRRNNLDFIFQLS